MPFHRFITPTYSGGLPVGYDYINDPAANGDPGVPAPADGKKGPAAAPGDQNEGTYFVAFKEPGIVLAVNRLGAALAENTDQLDDLIHRDLGVPATEDFPVPGAPVTDFTITEDVFVGVSATLTDPNQLSRLVGVYDVIGKPLVVDTGGGDWQHVQVTAIEATLGGGSVVGGGFQANPVISVSPAIPAGTTYGARFLKKDSVAVQPAGLAVPDHWHSVGTLLATLAQALPVGVLISPPIQAGVLTINRAIGDSFRVPLVEDITTVTLASAPPANRALHTKIVFVQDTTYWSLPTSWAGVTWWIPGSAPVMPASAGEVLVVDLYANGTETIGDWRMQTPVATPLTILGGANVPYWCDVERGRVMGTGPDIASLTNLANPGVHNVTQGTESKRPHLISIGGKLFALFDESASQDLQSVDADLWAAGAPGEVSLWVSARVDTDTANRALCMLGLDGGGSNSGINIRSTPTALAYSRLFADGSLSTINGLYDSPGAVRVFHTRYTADVHSLRVNGAQVATAAKTGTLTNACDRVAIGSLGASEFHDGAIKSLVLGVGTFSPLQHAQMNEYMMQDAGL
jgi:hypothetical protein